MWEYSLVKITNFEVCVSFSFHKSVPFSLPLLPRLLICAYCHSH